MSYPYLSIRTNENGENKIVVDSHKGEVEFELSGEGAAEAGRHLRSIGASTWLCSSSLDFPGEYDKSISAFLLESKINEGWDSSE